MAEPLAAGWDLGGAHLKLAQAASGGEIVEVAQLPCPLWQGLAELEAALAAARARLGPVARHGVTMTGELADVFMSRAEGVEKLIEAMVRAFPDGDLRVYAGRDGFLDPAAAAARPEHVASANWLASASFVAGRERQGVFVDMGSTTTDMLPFRDGRALAAGHADAERLAAGELVYTGLTRTPVIAIARQVPFAGERQPLMAELFATMADVYRLTGSLPEDADQLPTADGADKSLESSARRLARMLGRDLESAPMGAWRRLAALLAERQLRHLQGSLERLLSRGDVAEEAPLVGAGVGRFLVRTLAERARRPYRDFSELVSGSPGAREGAARAAPAAAVALLAAEGW